MKVAYVDPHPAPDIKPETLQILQNVEALASHCDEVHLVTPESATSAESILGRSLPSNIKITHFFDAKNVPWIPFNSNRFYLWQLKSWLKKKSVDFLIVRNIKLAGRLINSKNIPPILFESHEIFAQSYAESHDINISKNRRNWHKLRKLEQTVYGQCAGLSTLTQALADDLQEQYQTRRSILISPDGFDEIAATQALAKPKLNNEHAAILYLGSLHPWKGVETAIRSMQSVERAVLHIVGGTQQRIQELQELTQQLGIEDKVLLKGAVAPAQRFDVIQQADICVLPLSNTSIGSRYTSPLKLFEYMAMNKPIVCADVPAIREILTNGENALLVPPEDSEAMAFALSKIISDNTMAEQLASNAAQHSKQFSWNNRAKAICDYTAEQLRR